VLLSKPQDSISGDTHFVNPAIIYAETLYVLITQCLCSALRDPSYNGTRIWRFRNCLSVTNNASCYAENGD